MVGNGELPQYSLHSAASQFRGELSAGFIRSRTIPCSIGKPADARAAARGTENRARGRGAGAAAAACSGVDALRVSGSSSRGRSSQAWRTASA